MAKSGTLDDLYLEWLYSQFAAVSNENPRRCYWLVARQLYKMPFVWTMRNDEHRAKDGIALRNEFIHECDIEDIEVNWLQLGCSMLELLVGLSRRAAFQAQGSPGEWFMVFLENMGIRFSDAMYTPARRELVDAAIIRVNTRTYRWNGKNGIFPLKTAQEDQRSVELWYQMSAYLIEGNYIDHAP